MKEAIEALEKRKADAVLHATSTKTEIARREKDLAEMRASVRKWEAAAEQCTEAIRLLNEVGS